MSADVISPRNRRIAIVAVLLLVAAILVAIALTRGRGESEWDKVQAELIAKGEDLDWAKLLPPRVPDSENFFKDPFAQHFIKAKGGPRAADPVPEGLLRAGQSGTEPHFPPSIQPLTLAEVKALPRLEAEKGTNSHSLEGLEKWFSQWDDMYEGLRKASHLPHARFDGSYEDPFAMPIPSFVDLRRHAHVIACRARVHLLLGNPARALDDLDSLEALMKACNAQPQTLVSAMIHTAFGGLYSEIVQEGLADGLWNEAELTGLTKRLGSLALISSVQRGLREGERNGVGRFFDDLAHPRGSAKRKAAVAALGAGLGFSPTDVLVRSLPKAWVRRNQAVHAGLIQIFIESMDGEAQRYYPSRAAAAAREMNEAFKKWSPHKMLAAIATPNFIKAGRTVAFTQTSVNQAAIVAALELHRLKHGQYPDALPELTLPAGTKLPHDIITGEPMIYRRNSESFLLYSVGLNQKDDGGLAGETLDWVWASNK